MIQLNGEIIIKDVIWSSVDSIDEGYDFFKKDGGLFNRLLFERVEVCLCNNAVIQGLSYADQSPLQCLQVQTVSLRQLSFLQD